MSYTVAVQTRIAKAALSDSSSLLLQRKCACGGSAGLTGNCTHCHSEKFLGQALQTKLRVNAPGDEYEQEADRMAEQVMRMSEPNRQPETSRTDVRSHVQRKLSGAETSIEAAPSIIQDVLSSPGQPLDAASRAFFEPRFGHDLGHVIIHTDEQAAASARAVKARAYTAGQHIAFDVGQYAPKTNEGKRLLAHELTHTVQQHSHRSLGIGTVNNLVNGPVEYDQRSAERTFTGATCNREKQQLSTHHVNNLRLDHPLAVQRMCTGSPKTRNAIVSQKEDDYKQAVNAGKYCLDTGFTGALHSGTCYREVPRRDSYWHCPGGDQVCFDKGTCKDSPDKRSPVEKQEADGSCNLSGWCAARHGVREVEPVQGAILGKLLWPVGGAAIGALAGWLLGRE